MSKLLLSGFSKKGLDLKNRVVMAPMTRSRATENIPNSLMASYYSQRADAGLIITEGTTPSPNGLGYARIPGIYEERQIAGWRKVTEAVHEKGSKIFLQLMHTGRISHLLNMPEGARVIAPSAVPAGGEIWTDQKQMQPHSTPEAMTSEDIKAAIQEFVTAARNAVEAGFDGVEIHGANGYLIEQFLHPDVNKRTDEYGGNFKNRSKFLLQIVSGVADAIGKDKTGVRLSPHGVAGDLSPYDEVEETYTYLAQEMAREGILYLHLVDHSSMGSPEVSATTIQSIRDSFPGILILSGGYSSERAENDLKNAKGDLVAFGRPFISNPDFVERLESNSKLNDLNPEYLYMGGETGYIDYPFLNEQEITPNTSAVPMS